MKGLLIAQVLFDCTEGQFVPNKSLNIKIEECQTPDPIICEAGQDCPKWNCTESKDELSCEARCSSNNELAKKQKCSCYTMNGPLKFFTGCKWVVEQEEQSCALEKSTSSSESSTTGSKNSETEVEIEDAESTEIAEKTEEDKFSDCRALNDAKFWKCDQPRSYKAKCRLPCRNQLNIINRCFCVKGRCKWTLPLDTRCKDNTLARPSNSDTDEMLFDVNTNGVTEQGLKQEQREPEEPEEPEEKSSAPQVRSASSRLQMIRPSSASNQKTYRGMRYIEQDGRRLFNQNDLISQFLGWFKTNY